MKTGFKKKAANERKARPAFALDTRCRLDLNSYQLALAHVTRDVTINTRDKELLP